MRRTTPARLVSWFLTVNLLAGCGSDGSGPSAPGTPTVPDPDVYEAVANPLAKKKSVAPLQKVGAPAN